MSWTVALLLAVLQGLTEFLPVSSSGHLVLLENAVRRLTGRPLPDALAFNLLLHVGTVVAVLIYFRRDLADMARGLVQARRRGSALTAAGGGSDNGPRELLMMGTALLPTVLVGLTLRTVVNHLLHRPVIVSCLTGVTGIVLLASRPRRAPAPGGRVTWLQALAVGTAQGFAVLPGLSRSGLTIAAGLALGMRPMNAFRWSFLLSIPVILGAAGLEILAAEGALEGLGWPAVVAALVAAAVALGALRILAWSLGRAHFHDFAWYCFAVAIGGTILFSVWGA